MKLSKKEEIIQDALGLLPEWVVRFKIKLSSNLSHWRSPYWSYYHYEHYFTKVTAIDKQLARRKAVEKLRKFYLPVTVDFRTTNIDKLSEQYDR